jgi:hypothetical protein
MVEFTVCPQAYVYMEVGGVFFLPQEVQRTSLPHVDAALAV